MTGRVLRCGFKWFSWIYVNARFLGNNAEYYYPMFLTVVECVVIDFRKIVFLLSFVSIAACETSLNQDTAPIDSAPVGDFVWYYKLSPIDLTERLNPEEITIWHGRQGSTPYATKAECISAGEKSRINIKYGWNYKIECREQAHPSQIPISLIDADDLEIVEDR